MNLDYIYGMLDCLCFETYSNEILEHCKCTLENSNAINDDWRFGTLRLDVKPDGGR